MTAPNFVPGDQVDSCYAICPYCGCQTGDCDEWLSQNPEVHECDRCGRKYRAWAEYSADYYTEPLEES